MTQYRLTPLADALPSTVPFVGPETQERAMGRAFDARLGANENVFGPSPRAIEAMAQAQQWMYGDPEKPHSGGLFIPAAFIMSRSQWTLPVAAP